MSDLIWLLSFSISTLSASRNWLRWRDHTLQNRFLVVVTNLLREEGNAYPKMNQGMPTFWQASICLVNSSMKFFLFGAPRVLERIL